MFVPDEGLLIVVGERVTLPPHGKWDGSLPFWLDGKGEGSGEEEEWGSGRKESKEALKKEYVHT